jgi:hypothetical protein
MALGMQLDSYPALSLTCWGDNLMARKIAYRGSATGRPLTIGWIALTVEDGQLHRLLCECMLIQKVHRLDPIDRLDASVTA